MKVKLLTMMAVAGSLLAGCDETTDMIGNTLANSNKIVITTDTFNVTSRSVQVESVLARNSTSYIGKIVDEETGAYVTSNSMLQFRIAENYQFPALDRLVSRNAKNEVIVDSCKLVLYYEDYFGNPLQTMKLSVNEMDKPMVENQLYQSNFNPEAAGYIRQNGLKVEKTYTLTDLTVSDSIRNIKGYRKNITIALNDSYTDKKGVVYENYGTYILRKYYENPGYFKNAINLITNVMPGFYIKHVSGLGSMAYVKTPELILYFRYQSTDANNKIQTNKGVTIFSATEEVLQTTHINNDSEAIARLVADPACTYVKTPAGIFTELTLPVDEMLKGHDKDMLNTAKLTINRLNNNTTSKDAFAPASYLMIIPKDSVASFFDRNKIVDNKLSYVAAHINNAYTFSNIAGIINAMNKAGKASPNWNKAILIPVSITTDSKGTITRVVHDMSLTSTKLMGGTANQQGAIKINAIYSKFQ